MSDETTHEAQAPAEAPAPEEQEVANSVEAPVEEAAPAEAEATEATPEELDLYEEARKSNEALKAELDEIKASDANVFAQNEELKKQIEDAKKIKEISEQNAQLQAELNGIKKADLIANMTNNGQLSVAMGDWAESQSYENLQQFAKIAPKHKTILNQKNPANEATDIAKKFNEEQNRSRIHI
jgi:hypothetical protein